MSKLYDLVSQLRNMDIEKADRNIILKNYCKEDPWIKEVLKMTYDPFIQFFIKSKYPNFVKVENPIISFDEIFWNTAIKPLLIQLNKRELNTKDYTKVLIGIMKTLSEEDQELLKCIITKDLKLGYAAKSINSILEEELIPTNNTQLCKTYTTDMVIKKVDGWWASRKLNGLRGRWLIKNNKYSFLTREDFPLIGFDEVTKELDYLQKKYDLSLIDGEIFNFNLPFQSIMSVARGEKSFDPQQKSLLVLNVFNIQRNNYKYKDTKEMIDYMKMVFENEKDNLSHIVMLEYEWINNTPKEIVKITEKYTTEGYEGVVLRDPIVSWEGGKRNNHLLKFKLFFECDLKVRDVLYGVSGKKWENQVTAYLCEGIVRARKTDLGYRPVSQLEDYDDAEYTDIKIRVEASCSSCTDEEREAITELDTKAIGRIAEVKFWNFTDKPNEDGYYSLQFPVFLKFKDLTN